MLRKQINYKNSIKYVIIFLAYVSLNNLLDNSPPLALPLYIASMFIGLNGLSLSLLYVLSFFQFYTATTLLIVVLPTVLIYIIFSIYNSKNKIPNVELIGFCLLSLIGFIAIGKGYNLTVRIVLSSIMIILVYIFLTAVKVFYFKQLKFKISLDEFICASILYVLVGMGLINAFSIDVYSSLAILILLIFINLFPNSLSLIIAFVVSIPECAGAYSLLPISIYILYAVVSLMFVKYSRLLAGIAVIAVELCLYYIVPVYDMAEIYSILYLLMPLVIYLLIPDSAIQNLQSKLKIYKRSNLPRESINSMRMQISGKLYEISAVFDEMASSISALNIKQENKEQMLAKMACEVLVNLCSNCQNYPSCKQSYFPTDEQLINLINIGVAKGQINYNDMPSVFVDTCVVNGSMIEQINSLIEEYNQHILQTESLSIGRKLIADQSQGISGALKGVALDMAKCIDFDVKLEDTLRDYLFRCGIIVSEVLIFGEGDNTEISLTINSSDVEKKYLVSAINECLKKSFTMIQKTNLTADLSVVRLKVQARYDAVFGIASIAKADKRYCGDTHSVYRISDSKFLIALNDGMGSGEDAKRTSTVALNLVESFYKAGLDSQLILKTVNKILSLSTQDNFTAMDIGIVDLYTGDVQFIKIGSPFSFIIHKDSVRIIEGSSLPLGILDEMTPSISTYKLASEDTVIFMSDGITDAFKSSSDMIEFLSREKLINPKVIADRILARAIELNGGTAKDDMTVLVVRIINFKKS